MLSSAHQGYIYQDILGAYFIASELAQGKGETSLHFDHKKTQKGIPDKFDDLVIYSKEETVFIQVKYSNEENQHKLTKKDFSSSGPYDLALFDLFKTWKALHKPSFKWRVCLAWDQPVHNDPIRDVMTQLPDDISFLPGTVCYQFNIDVLWPETRGVLNSWRALKEWSNSCDRQEFQAFLSCLVVELGCPKSTLLKDYSQGLERLLARAIEKIGIGVYPNDHLTIRQVAESFCAIARSRRATNNSIPISCDEIAKLANIEQSNGGIEQHFPIDEKVLVATPGRIHQVISALEEHGKIIITAEPGAGKSWFIENLQIHLEETIQIVKHYCYTALEDPLAVERVTVNVLYGSLITQILQSDDKLPRHMTRRYASNLEQLNILLGNIQKKTLLIVDGIDHIWRVYQKNRGGLTENETTILKALAQLDISNPNVSLLVISQPIEKLVELTSFFQFTLAPLSEEFVSELLKKHAVPNSEVEEVSLAEVIHEKSKGNALYCKYLIDQAITHKTHTSFDWISNLPPYDFNLTSYYEYLYEQIQGDTRVPYALCGADFSLTERELQEITHLGEIVITQLGFLKPVLKYISAIGYSIYHESFKRFVIDTINSQGASISHLIYQPLILWLETHSFFESIKAFGHLLKLYYEVDSYHNIAETISVDFIDTSLYHAQPFHYISQNHRLQRMSLKYVDSFVPMLIIAEQAKIIYEFDHVTDQVLINYLKAVQVIHGEGAMYRVLWDGENLLVNTKDALGFLVGQAYQGKSIVHWSIIPRLSSIPYDILGYISVKYLHTEEYEKFDRLVKDVYENPEYRKAFINILDEIEWWNIFRGTDWKVHTPYFQSVMDNFYPTSSALNKVVRDIIQDESFQFNDNWRTILRDLVVATKSASDDERSAAINDLSNYNWFRNWLIYLIKITELSIRTCDDDEILDAFTYLIRDLEPFKGEPRVSDLYRQLPFIKKSFHRGLLLCNGNEELLIKCCEMLEKVTNVTTSIQGSVSGPLTDEEFLELIGFYLPGKYIIGKYEEYYRPLGSRRLYSYVAETAFEYARVLSVAGRDVEAKNKYLEGIQALTAYGFRKDRTLSEVLYCSVPYQKTYGKLDVSWFYELYHMAMTVVTHTDGKSTSHYPIEWFEEFIKVYPNEALRFLISETLENKEASWHQENEFYHVLEEKPTLFSPTQWFLLCRSLPLASSEKILAYGLSIIDEIEEPLQDIYHKWLQSLPYKIEIADGANYTKEVITQFKHYFGITLKSKGDDKDIETISSPEDSSFLVQFSGNSVDEILAFLEVHKLSEEHLPQFQQLISSISDLEEKKKILRQVAKKFRYGRDVEEWVNNFFEPDSDEWLYFNVCLFVFLTDGWFHGLHYTFYLKRAYDAAPDETLLTLREVLGYSLSDSGYHYANLISCNLIKALSELKVNEQQVYELLDLTFHIVKRRLPHPPNSEVNAALYEGLEEFSQDELFVVLLIARLKTLTTEKTQGIIWSLTFIAQTIPETLFKPYSWAFSHYQLLLPIHRALLLQILKKHTDPHTIPDELIGLLISIYPTGFFLEDQYIRSFVGYQIELDENTARSVLLEGHQYDAEFFLYMHVKYRTLFRHFGTLKGSYRAYAFRRDKISEEHKSYYIRTEEVLTPIIPNANAAYEIVNKQWYKELKDLTNDYNTTYICDLEFFIPEIIINVGALAKRPPYIPTPEHFPEFENFETNSPLEYEGWIVLASKEKEWFGERFQSKKCHYASRVLTFGEKPSLGESFYARYLFKADIYRRGVIEEAPIDQPICHLNILDTLEQSRLLYVSPWIIRELGLKIHANIHNGFQAVNDQGEVIIKMITWKEDYYGSVSDGTEVPRLDGVAVLIKSGWYDRLLSLYDIKGWYVLRKSENEEKV